MPAEAYVAVSRAAKNAVVKARGGVRRPWRPHFCYRASDRTSKEEANVTRNLSAIFARGPRAGWRVAAALALGLLGCGDDGSSNPATTSTATGTGTGTTTTSTGGGGGAGGAAAGACFDYASWDGTAPATTFKADVLPLFRRSCGLSTSCHGADPGPAGQPYLGAAQSAGEMTPAQIEAVLAANVGVASAKEPTMKLVAAGDPAKSFLLHKLDGPSCDALACAASGTCGEQMPQGSALAPTERDVVRRWIAQGAKND
jgi:hypothetical protein